MMDSSKSTDFHCPEGSTLPSIRSYNTSHTAVDVFCANFRKTLRDTPLATTFGRYKSGTPRVKMHLRSLRSILAEPHDIVGDEGLPPTTNSSHGNI